jgi:3-methyladenine DNA glycosylase Mpg
MLTLNFNRDAKSVARDLIGSYSVCRRRDTRRQKAARFRIIRTPRIGVDMPDQFRRQEVSLRDEQT